MDNDFNWKLASNSQLKEECERLEKEFVEKQQEMRQHAEIIDALNETMIELSKQYVVVKDILDKRQGKNKKSD